MYSVYSQKYKNQFCSKFCKPKQISISNNNFNSLETNNLQLIAPNIANYILKMNLS